MPALTCPVIVTATTTFSIYGDADTPGYLVPLIEELGGPAVMVGHSLTALLGGPPPPLLRPALVSGLVLLGPFIAPLGGRRFGAKSYVAASRSGRRSERTPRPGAPIW